MIRAARRCRRYRRRPAQPRHLDWTKVAAKCHQPWRLDSSGFPSGERRTDVECGCCGPRREACGRGRGGGRSTRGFEWDVSCIAHAPAARLVHWRAEGGRTPTSVSFLIYKRGIHDRLVYVHYPCIETSLAPPRRRAPLLVCPIRSARPLGIGAGGPQEATGLFCDRPCVRAPVISPAVAGSRGNLGGFSLTHHPCADRLESEGRCPRREALGPGR